jgi:hypothetical protein
LQRDASTAGEAAKCRKNGEIRATMETGQPFGLVGKTGQPNDGMDVPGEHMSIRRGLRFMSADERPVVELLANCNGPVRRGGAGVAVVVSHDEDDFQLPMPGSPVRHDL